MKITKKRLLEEIKAVIAEENNLGFSDGTEHVGMKTKGPYEREEDEEPFDHFFEMVPDPRSRVSDIESYKKVYSYLMGHPAAAMRTPLEEIMKELGAGCPMSTAQALADYLTDRAKIK